MQQVLIYIGLTLVVIGCVIGMYGGFKWKSEQTKTLLFRNILKL